VLTFPCGLGKSLSAEVERPVLGSKCRLGVLWRASSPAHTLVSSRRGGDFLSTESATILFTDQVGPTELSQRPRDSPLGALGFESVDPLLNPVEKLLVTFFDTGETLDDEAELKARDGGHDDLKRELGFVKVVIS
jgi:hypothetical protein